MTTPSALSKVASQYFLDAQPPLLSQEGTTLRSIRIHSHLHRPPLLQSSSVARRLHLRCVQSEALMAHENIPVLIFLAMLLLAGLALIADAVRRAVSEGRGKNHDLHV